MSDLPDSFMLDASALLCVLLEERGEDAVLTHIERCGILSVQYAEVLSKLMQRGGTFEQSRNAINVLRIPVIDFDRVRATETARLHAMLRSHGISFADAACLAAASLGGRGVLTADRAWSRLNALSHIPIVQIRPNS
jgi:PIN domain nuclease of toxin-antitoxin system